ncbi:MAG: class I SAM-dependent methyltransferase, partial [Bacteroidia bacterium]|nr:class I SAM-dependent methyltransferase [Bacteroidia bacterium]
MDIRLQFRQQLETAREYIVPFVSRHMRVGEGTKVLDVGCGTGGVCMAFAQTGAETLGVDLSDVSIAVALEFCAERSGQMRFWQKNVYDFDADEKFDLIVFKDSIEHIPEQARIIAHVKRFLNPNGMIFFGFPPWHMPFGGHQQVMRKRKWLSLAPYIHLLPKSWYR